MTNDYLDAPHVIDPITRKNVAKNSFRIEDVKETFGVAFDFIQNIKIQYDKTLNKDQNQNFITEFLLNA